MNRIFVTVAAAALMGAGGVALAQQDANNPAPNYASTPAVQNHQVKHIEDGINAAPRYPTVAPVHSTNATPIRMATTRRRSCNRLPPRRRRLRGG